MAKPNDCMGQPHDNTLGLLESEDVVANHLREAWNAFVKLPVQHDDDVSEFRHAIHSLQYLLGIRAMRRIHSGWTNKEGENECNS